MDKILAAAFLLVMLAIPLVKIGRKSKFKVRVKRAVAKAKASASRARRGNQHDYRKHMLILWSRDGGICQICGEPIDPAHKHPHPRSVSIDHIRALSRGGTHDIENLQLAHLACNLAKGSRRAPRKRKG